ncbi:hypothetical protein Tco_1155282 [Tanacetum coccineum]
MSSCPSDLISQELGSNPGLFLQLDPLDRSNELLRRRNAEGDDKPESKWTLDERRVVVQDQRLKNIIMSCLPDDIMESVIRCETAKGTWTDLGLRNANYTQTLDLANICGSTAISTAFFSNNVIQDFQENSDNEVDERSSEEYLRDLDIDQTDLKVQKDYKAEYRKMKGKLALLEANPSTSQTPKTFQPKNNVLVAKTFDWDEEEVSDDEEVTQVKVLMALADDELTVRKNHARNGEWIDITMRKFVEEQRLNLLSKYNKIVFKLNKCRDELLVLKQAKLDAVTFQIQNTELTKLNHALQEQLKEEKKINEKQLTSSKKVSQCISKQIPHQKKKVLEMVPKSKDWVGRLNPDSKLLNFNTGRVLVPESQAVNKSLKPTNTSITPESSKDSEAESLIPLPPLKNLQGASPSSESVSGTVTVSETEPTIPSIPAEVKDTQQESKINELTKLVQMLIDEKVNSTQKTQESNLQIQQTKSSRPKPIQKPQLKCELCHYTNHSTDDCYKILYCMICKREDHRTSDHEMYTASLKRSENYKAQPFPYAYPSKQIVKAKPKPFLPCTHCGFNDHRPDDCRNYPECGICRSYDHFTTGHNRVTHIRGGVLAESSQSSESSIGVKCNTCGSTVHSTTDHNEFDHFKRETHQGAHLVPGQLMLKE